MDETSVITQQYYIATRSSPTDDRPRVLKYGEMFAVFDRYGDIETGGLGEQGIFYSGTRFLSKLAFQMWDARPLLLSSTVKSDNFLFTADLANADVSFEDHVEIPRGILHVLRSKFLWEQTCYEQFKITNFGATPITIPLSLEFDADFADIFEVRGMHRDHRGHRLSDQVAGDSVLLSYEGLDGGVRETYIHSHPRPLRVSDSLIQFESTLNPGEETSFEIAVSCNPTNKTVLGYKDALATAINEVTAAENIPQISSPNSRFSDWMKRSAADVYLMIRGNPEANYPYAGVPWFSTVFGRDGIITALEMLWVSPWIGKGVLEYLAATQATELNPEIEAEPGKILHEQRGGEMASLGEVPFGRYYGTVDATPLFVMLAGAYYDRTGDREFLQQLWPHIELALKWIDEYGDSDGDGFVEYARHSSRGGLVQQGWKDSNDSVFHAGGTLAEAPIAICEVQGYVYAAKLAAARIASVLGDENKAVRLKQQAAELKQNFETAFWCPDLSTYALALDGHKQPCRVRASNAGHCLFTGIANPDKAEQIAWTLLGPEFFTGWGIRTLAAGEARYNPLSYHNGSVWPHDNALIASGIARYGFKDLAGQILLGMLDVSSMVDLRRLPELFCGLDRRTGEGPTLYPVACSPQAWAAGAGFLVLQACLGITVHDAEKKVILDHPYLPAGIPQLWIKGLRSGNAVVDLQLERDDDLVGVQILHKQGELEIVVK